MPHMVIDRTYWPMGFDGWLVKVASVGDPNEGTGTVLLEVEVPREGRRPWEPRSDRWVFEVPAGQLDEAQALYPPGGKSESGELGKARNAVQYRRVTVEFGPSYLTQSRHVWLRRLFRRPIELSDVKWVEFGNLYEDS
ncbi:hypothetical protein ITI46_34445 [Streptomyces oryzae]|uniref:Uncharacterized protein n=1 Tax=Streptomyces oryzae TaxID=1434886 RepID=A0ABS3XMQ9_9ACTN|nr:hypothetical protein [Streptomyces oryzae]MBO8196692.1 hypothetical protein [Streptomyces oryzae]